MTVSPNSKRIQMCTGGLSCSYPPSPATLLSKVALVVKNLPANSRDIRDVGSIPGSGRSPGGGHGNSLQYSCLQNVMDRGAWRATVHKVAKSWTLMKWLSMHAQRTDSTVGLVWDQECQHNLAWVPSPNHPSLTDTDVPMLKGFVW